MGETLRSESDGAAAPSGTLPPAAPRGPPPAGVRLEERRHAGECLVADADFDVGELVLRERFLLLGPTELPPLDMFSPVPPEVANVEMKGEGFPGVTSWDHQHLKLLFEFANAEDDVQADALRMQDEMSAGETRQSIEQVARWLTDRQSPWLGELNFHDVFRVLRLFCVNSYPCRAAGSTSGLLKWGTMINHSCRPNVTFQTMEVDGEFEGCYRAVRPIKKGDLLGSSYMKPAVQLASLEHRRRVLWCLKGFICCCERCCHEAAHGDSSRYLCCSNCAEHNEACQMRWQCHPSVGSNCFVGQHCGRIADSQGTRAEAQTCAEVIWAFFRHWQSYEEASESTTELRKRTESLPEDHFARRGLEALLLSLEGEFLASARHRSQLQVAAAKNWLQRVAALRRWMERFREEPPSSLVLLLAFGGLAPSIQDLSDATQTEAELQDSWLHELATWSRSMLALDAIANDTN